MNGTKDFFQIVLQIYFQTNETNIFFLNFVKKNIYKRMKKIFFLNFVIFITLEKYVCMYV